MRKVISFLIALVMIISFVNVSAMELFYDGANHTYNGNIFTLKVNGKVLKCDVPPVVFNDYSVVPARDVFESLGATVSWNGQSQKVTIDYKSTKIEVFINDTISRKNGKSEVMAIAPKLINGKTMIPVRYVAESLGFDVNFDSKTDTISINAPKSETKPSTETVKPVVTTKPTYDITLKSYTYERQDDTVITTFVFDKSVEFSHFILKEPTRIVVDTKNTKFTTATKSAETGYDDVTGIRLGQQTEGVRFVFDLSEALDYRVIASGKKLIVKIGKDIKDEIITEETDETEETEPEVPVIPDPPSYAPTRTVYLDPGHGGSDPGAIYTDEDGTIWRESEINLAVALKVRDILKASNVKVMMSRETDKTVELVSRPLDANQKQATLFVSVHTNSFASDTAYGIETWGTLEYSATYAGVTDKNLAENIQKAVIKQTGGYSRGVKDSTGLAVLKHSIMPSVLIEVGFISNTEERNQMFSDSYRDKLAKGIAEGILKTLTEMGL